MTKVKFALRGLFSLALIAFILRKIDWRDLGTVLARIDWRWAVPGSLLTGILIVGLAVRWRIFLRQQGIELSLGKILSLIWAGQFFNSVLPGSTGGDVFKIYQICRLAPDRKAAAAASVLIDRLSAFFALGILATIGFILEPTPLWTLIGGRLDRGLVAWLAIALFFALGLVALLWRVSHANRWAGRLRRTLLTVFTSVRPNGSTAFAVLLAFTIHLLNFLGVYLFARSLGMEVALFQVFVMMSVVLLLVMLPVTINGHGLRELLLIAYFTHMGIRVGQQTEIGYQEVAVALSLLMVANDLLWSLPGGVQYLARFRLAREPQLIPNPM